MEDIGLDRNFTVEVSGHMMSLEWKPRSRLEHNLVAFVDGQGFYSSTYFTFDELRNKENLIPHIMLDSEQSNKETTGKEIVLRLLFTNLFTNNKVKLSRQQNFR